MYLIREKMFIFLV